MRNPRFDRLPAYENLLNVVGWARLPGGHMSVCKGGEGAQVIRDFVERVGRGEFVGGREGIIK